MKNGVQVVLIDIATKNVIAYSRVPWDAANASQTRSPMHAFSPDSSVLAVLTAKRLHVVSVPDGEVLISQPALEDADWVTASRDATPDWYPTHLQFADDGSRLAAGSTERRRGEEVVYFWDLSSARLPAPAQYAHRSPVLKARVDPQDQELVYLTNTVTALNRKLPLRDPAVLSDGSSEAGVHRPQQSPNWQLVTYSESTISRHQSSSLENFSQPVALSPGFDPSGQVYIHWVFARRNGVGQLAPYVGEPETDFLDAGTGQLRETVKGWSLFGSSRDRKWLAFTRAEGARGRVARLFDTTELKWAGDLPETFDVYFSPDNQFAFAAHEDFMHVARCQDGKSIGKIPCGTSSYTAPFFDAAGSVAAIAERLENKPAFRLRLIEVATGRQFGQVEDVGTDDTRWPPLAICDGGLRLALAKLDGPDTYGQTWHAEVWTKDQPDLVKLQSNWKWTGISRLLLSSDGNRLLIFGAQPKMPGDNQFNAVVALELWDLVDRKLLASTRNNPMSFVTWRINPSANKLAITFTEKPPEAMGVDPDAFKSVTAVWDVNTGMSVREFQDCQIAAPSLGSPYDHPFRCGRYLPLLAKGSTMIVDMTTASEHATLAEKIQWGWKVGSLSPDGEILVTTDSQQQPVLSQQQVVLWRLSEKQRIPLPCRPDTLECFSANGRYLLTNDARELQSLRVWDTATGSLLQTISLASGQQLAGKPAPVQFAQFSPDGMCVAFRIYGQTRLASRETGQVHAALSRDGHAGTVLSFAHSPDGRFVATASSDQTVGLWRTGDGRFMALLEGYDGPVQSVAFPDNSRLAAVDAQGKLAMWSVKEQLAADRPFLKATLLWQRNMAAAPARQDPPKGRWLLASNSKNELLCIASPDGSISLLRAEDGQLLKTLSPQDQTSHPNAIVFDAAGQRLAAAGSDGAVRLWSIPDGRLVESWKTDQGETHALAFQPGGRLLASAGKDIRLWSTEPSRLLLVLAKHSKAVRDISFCSQGAHLISSSDDGDVLLWDFQRLAAEMDKLGLGLHIPATAASNPHP